jgi:hypothetical protein
MRAARTEGADADAELETTKLLTALAEARKVRERAPTPEAPDEAASSSSSPLADWLRWARPLAVAVAVASV